MVTLKRHPENPILMPQENHEWEHDGAFNGCVTYANGLYHMVYRALSSEREQRGINMRISSVGYAQSTDGIHFTDQRLLFGPEEDWEIYGVEDPRITYFNDEFYIFYTALSVYPFAAYGIKLALAKTKDFKTFVKHPVTTFNSKAMALFPEKVNGKMAALLTINTDLPPAKISVAEFDHEADITSPFYWEEWYDNANSHILPLLRDMRDQVELGAPPVKTDEGWLVIYSYIGNYLSNNKTFGIEALLLDHNDPRKIIGRTQGPLLVPEAGYEKEGDVPDIAFPSGALIHDDELWVYYGAADTRCALATCNLKDLLNEMKPKSSVVKEEPKAKETKLVRFSGNPILEPKLELDWQAAGIFNPAAVYEDGKIHILYRAQLTNGTSTFGYASTTDGFHLDENLDEPIYFPRADFEKKTQPVGNSGCEDPRLTKIDDKFYVTYTAFDGQNPPRVALSSIAVTDFLKKEWNWSQPKLISPPGMDDKDACVVKNTHGEGYIAFHRLQDAIWIDFLKDLNFDDGKFLEGQILVTARKDKWDNLKIGIAGPPMETDHGWLLLYHGVTEADSFYKVGALLLDYDDPRKIIKKTDAPILEPEMEYEKVGQIPNVVFPCGSAIKDGTLFVYYGGADKVTGVATMPLKDLLDLLE